ncbi:MAG: SHD1 domain-containing protein [Verrucomicrobiota bacterium]
MLGCSFLQARTWTSTDGKEIEAELVKVEGEIVVLSMRGKEYRVPLNKLSDEDREFAESWEGASKDEEAGSADTEWELFGKVLKPGEVVEAETDLDEKVAKALSGNKLKPLKMKVKIELPAGFDPAKPQHVFWCVGGINNEDERKRGNIGTWGRGKVPSSKGWVVVSADTEHGNPRESTVQLCEGDLEFHLQVIEELSKVFPDFKSWKHACGGHSSGAKGSFFRIAQLLEAEATVVGGFFSGCNQCMGPMAAEEAGVRKSKFKPVKAYLSTGDQDNLVPASTIKRMEGDLKDAGFREIQSKIFPGGHVSSNEQFAEALDWFVAE